MNNYNTTTKADVKNLNSKQTVIIEVVTTTEKDKKKVVKNIYLGNWKRRRDAFYLGMQEDQMKEVRKGETTKSYRLLKLSKALAEVSAPGYNTKTNYLLIEGYNDETPVAIPEKTETPAEDSTDEVAEETVPETNSPKVDSPEEEENHCEDAVC